MVVNVCPAGVARATPERLWAIISNPARFGDWLDVTLSSAAPPGAVVAGRLYRFETRELGRTWPVDIEVTGVDPAHRWIDLRVRLPFGIVNDEHVTLSPTAGGDTLVRFN